MACNTYDWLKKEKVELQYTFGDFGREYEYTFEVNAKEVYDLVYAWVVEDYFENVEISEEVKERFYDFLWNEDYHSIKWCNEKLIEYFESQAKEEFSDYARYWGLDV